MTDLLSNPHDRFFKEVFSRQETARDFLAHYLPAEVVNLLDLASLDISKDSFIDPDLQEHFSDLLYRVALREGGQSYVYVLFEHKSYPEAQIAFQLLRYMVRIWEQALKQQQELTPIVPVVVYHGRQGWRVGLTLGELLRPPEALKPYTPNYRYWLCDLSRYSDDEIRGAVVLRANLLLLKYILRDDLRKRLPEIIGLLASLGQQQSGLEYLEVMLRYITGGTDKISDQELTQVVLEAFNQGGSLMPTIAEKWLEQGRVEGQAKGLEQGVQQGKEATLKILRRFVTHRFSLPLDYFDAALAPLDLTALTKLSEAAFEANSLADFEAALAQVRPKAKPTSE